MGQQLMGDAERLQAKKAASALARLVGGVWRERALDSISWKRKEMMDFALELWGVEVRARVGLWRQGGAQVEIEWGGQLNAQGHPAGAYEHLPKGGGRAMEDFLGGCKRAFMIMAQALWGDEEFRAAVEKEGLRSCARDPQALPPVRSRL